MNIVNIFAPRIRMDKAILQWDKVVKGLGLRMNRDGTTQYIARISLNGRARWYTLGPVDLVKVDDARRLVQRMKLLARGGEDPADLISHFLRSGGLNQSAGISFADYSAVFIERYAKVYKKSWLKDQQRIRAYLLPLWSTRRLSEISRLDFVDVFSRIGKTRKIAANRLKETVSTMFRQAIVLGYLPDTHPNPTFGIRAYPERSRKNKIDASDLSNLIRAIKAHKQKVYAHAILFILFTGLRHGECIRLRWDWFDFANNSFTIPGCVTKNQEPHTMPLTGPLKRLLAIIPRYSNNPYLFPSPRTQKHIARLDKAWEKIRDRAGLSHLWLHDLRRSVGCLILDQTGSLTMVRDILNHTNQHVTAVYGYYDNKGMRPVLEAHGKLIESHFDS
jgi:integrase